MTPAFIVVITREFEALARVLLDSLEKFSKAPVVVIAFGFDFTHHHPRLRVERRESKETFFLDRLQAITDLGQIGVMLDADTVANWNVDGLLDLSLSKYQCLQQAAVCGSFDSKSREWLCPSDRQVYCNTVPIVITYQTLNWLSDSIETIKEVCGEFFGIHHCTIGDETLINWMRSISGINDTISIAGCDRQLFEPYMNGTQSIMEVQKNPLYANRKVTWHTFHGEKDPAVARQMFERLLEKGPEFLFRNAARCRKVSIYNGL